MGYAEEMEDIRLDNIRDTHRPAQPVANTNNAQPAQRPAGPTAAERTMPPDADDFHQPRADTSRNRAIPPNPPVTPEHKGIQYLTGLRPTKPLASEPL